MAAISPLVSSYNALLSALLLFAAQPPQQLSVPPWACGHPGTRQRKRRRLQRMARRRS